MPEEIEVGSDTSTLSMFVPKSGTPKYTFRIVSVICTMQNSNPPRI
jgi:hypothetical protein